MNELKKNFRKKLTLLSIKGSWLLPRSEIIHIFHFKVILPSFMVGAATQKLFCSSKRLQRRITNINFNA